MVEVCQLCGGETKVCPSCGYLMHRMPEMEKEELDPKDVAAGFEFWECCPCKTKCKEREYYQWYIWNPVTKELEWTGSG